MEKKELKKIMKMDYLQYCNYLQDKYGIPKYDYMTKSFNKNPKNSRTSEGLVIHHMDEDKMIMLSTKEFAEMCPFEWQTKERLVYCDYLEHLLLHVLICEYPSPERDPSVDVGIGGVVNFIVPELNDVYSGFVTKQAWRKNCYDKIINDKEIYLDIVYRFYKWLRKNGIRDADILCTSFNEQFGLWSKENNQNLFYTYWGWDFEE